MADIQPPPEGQINGGSGVGSGVGVGVGSKRQRKPSVRLGDIGGDPPYDRRNSTTATHKQHKPQSFSKDPNPSIKPSKTRPLTNLPSPPFQTLDPDSTRERAIGTWRLKDSSSKKRGPTKRLRSTWVSPNDNHFDNDHQGYNRDFDVVQNSESPVENFGADDNDDDDDDDRLQLNHQHHHRRSSSFKGSGGPSDTDATRDWNINNGGGEDGVRVWLSGLGLSRYAPIFQVHEVDDEVLPMLTLEDLKDMGINAVGTRRKLYSAIQKLGKGFT